MKVVVSISGPRFIVAHYSFIFDGKLMKENLIVMHTGLCSLGQYPGRIAPNGSDALITVFIHGSSLVERPKGRGENTAWNYRRLKPFV